MRITDFYEITLIQMNRKNKTWKDLSKVLNKSSVYTKQVVQGIQNGPKAKEYRQMIADYLDIVFVEEED